MNKERRMEDDEENTAADHLPSVRGMFEKIQRIKTLGQYSKAVLSRHLFRIKPLIKENRVKDWVYSMQLWQKGI